MLHDFKLIISQNQHSWHKICILLNLRIFKSNFLNDGGVDVSTANLDYAVILTHFVVYVLLHLSFVSGLISRIEYLLDKTLPDPLFLKLDTLHDLV